MGSGMDGAGRREQDRNGQEQDGSDPGGREQAGTGRAGLEQERGRNRLGQVGAGVWAGGWMAEHRNK